MTKPRKTDRRHYDVGWSDEYGEYIATCRELPGLSGTGATEAWALESIKCLVESVTTGKPPRKPDDEPFTDTP